MLLGLVIVAHLVGLPLVIWGHVKLYRSKRPGPLIYVLPLSWYLISLVCLVVGGICQDRWSYCAWNDDYTAHYLICVVAVVLMSLHGLWVARLLRQAGAPALCSWVLLSASLLLLLPPLGVILALVALRRIRESDGRLYGLRGAWASLAANVGMSLWLSVALACNWSEWFGSSGGAAKTGTSPVFPAPLITTSQAIRPLAMSDTGAVTTATAPGPNTEPFAGPGRSSPGRPRLVRLRAVQRPLDRAVRLRAKHSQHGRTAAPLGDVLFDSDPGSPYGARPDAGQESRGEWPVVGR